MWTCPRIPALVPLPAGPAFFLYIVEALETVIKAEEETAPCASCCTPACAGVCRSTPREMASEVAEELTGLRDQLTGLDALERYTSFLHMFIRHLPLSKTPLPVLPALPVSDGEKRWRRPLEEELEKKSIAGSQIHRRVGMFIRPMSRLVSSVRLFNTQSAKPPPPAPDPSELPILAVAGAPVSFRWTADENAPPVDTPSWLFELCCCLLLMAQRLQMTAEEREAEEDGTSKLGCSLGSTPPVAARTAWLRAAGILNMLDTQLLPLLPPRLQRLLPANLPAWREACLGHAQLLLYRCSEGCNASLRCRLARTAEMIFTPLKDHAPLRKLCEIVAQCHKFQDEHAEVETALTGYAPLIARGNHILHIWSSVGPAGNHWLCGAAESLVSEVEELVATVKEENAMIHLEMSVPAPPPLPTPAPLPAANPITLWAFAAAASRTSDSLIPKLRRRLRHTAGGGRSRAALDGMEAALVPPARSLLAAVQKRVPPPNHNFALRRKTAQIIDSLGFSVADVIRQTKKNCAEADELQDSLPTTTEPHLCRWIVERLRTIKERGQTTIEMLTVRSGQLQLLLSTVNKTTDTLSGAAESLPSESQRLRLRVDDQAAALRDALLDFRRELFDCREGMWAGLVGDRLCSSPDAAAARNTRRLEPSRIALGTAIRCCQMALAAAEERGAAGNGTDKWILEDFLMSIFDTIEDGVTLCHLREDVEDFNAQTWLRAAKTAERRKLQLLEGEANLSICSPPRQATTRCSVSSVSPFVPKCRPAGIAAPPYSPPSLAGSYRQTFASPPSLAGGQTFAASALLLSSKPCTSATVLPSKTDQEDFSSLVDALLSPTTAGVCRRIPPSVIRREREQLSRSVRGFGVNCRL